MKKIKNNYVIKKARLAGAGYITAHAQKVMIGIGLRSTRRLGSFISSISSSSLFTRQYSNNKEGIMATKRPACFTQLEEYAKKTPPVRKYNSLPLSSIMLRARSSLLLMATQLTSRLGYRPSGLVAIC